MNIIGKPGNGKPNTNLRFEWTGDVFKDIERLTGVNPVNARLIEYMKMKEVELANRRKPKVSNPILASNVCVAFFSCMFIVGLLSTVYVAVYSNSSKDFKLLNKQFKLEGKKKPPFHLEYVFAYNSTSSDLISKIQKKSNLSQIEIESASSYYRIFILVLADEISRSTLFLSFFYCYTQMYKKFVTSLVLTPNSPPIIWVVAFIGSTSFSFALAIVSVKWVIIFSNSLVELIKSKKFLK